MLGRAAAALSAARWRGGVPDLRAALRSGGNLLFALFVAVVLAFTLLAAVHSPDDPLVHPPFSHQLNDFLTSSTPASTFLTDDSVLRTGEEFNSSSPAALRER